MLRCSIVYRPPCFNLALAHLFQLYCCCEWGPSLNIRARGPTCWYISIIFSLAILKFHIIIRRLFGQIVSLHKNNITFPFSIQEASYQPTTFQRMRKVMFLHLSTSWSIGRTHNLIGIYVMTFSFLFFLEFIRMNCFYFRRWDKGCVHWQHRYYSLVCDRCRDMNRDLGPPWTLFLS